MTAVELDEIHAILDARDATIVRLTQALQASQDDAVAKQLVIEGLDRDCAERLALINRLDKQLQACSKGRLHNRLRVLAQHWVGIKLGVLYQHSPIPLRLPRSSYNPPRIKTYPKVSLVTPSFGQAGFIAQTMDSVLGQGYPNLEYFVQDGGSTDGTVEVLARYADRLSGWESRPDKGQSQAINLGFAQCTGEIMGWLNSDDLLLPGALARVVACFNAHPEVDVVYGNRIIIDGSGAQVGRWVLPGHDGETLRWADYVPQETLFWRRRIWDKIGGRIDESFHFALDWDLLLRFQEAGAKFKHLPRFLGAFRVHEQQKTSAEIEATGMAEMGRLRERCHGRSVTQTDITWSIAPFMLRHRLADLLDRLRTLFFDQVTT